MTFRRLDEVFAQDMGQALNNDEIVALQDYFNQNLESECDEIADDTEELEAFGMSEIDGQELCRWALLSSMSAPDEMLS